MRRSSSVFAPGCSLRLENRFHQQRFRFAGAGRAAEEAIFRRRRVEFLLLGKWRVAEIDFRGLERGRGFGGAGGLGSGSVLGLNVLHEALDAGCDRDHGGCRNSKCETRNESSRISYFE